MTSTEPFGAAKRYYSLEPGAAGDRFENGPAADDRIRRALPGDPDTIYRNIERVCRQKNQPIRELLRKQMGLGLKPETQDSIVVSVHDGLPAPFARLVAAKPAIPWELAARAELLSHSEEGLRFLLDRFEAVSRDYFDERPPAGRGDLERSRTLVEAILHDVEERKLRAELKAIAEDILGAYFFRRRGIEIYWLVIGFMAGLLRVSEESLATVVLTHELAHAFTHAGSDTDGHRWETKSFAAAPSEVIEGLAQFYTEAVCTKIAEREPGPLAAFHRLLRYQSEAYSSFQEWTRGSSNPRETIRAALVEARARGISTARDFQEFREKHRR